MVSSFSDSDISSYTGKPLVGKKHTLFDDIVGFEDVKSLFEMATKAEKSQKRNISNKLILKNKVD
jgi:hypothetical protein